MFSLKPGLITGITALLLASLSTLIFIAPTAPSHLYLRLSSTDSEPQRINAYFYKQGLKPDGIAFRDLAQPQETQAIYLNLPLHFNADGVIIDLGQSPQIWQVHDAKLRSRFLLFSLDTHVWSLSTFKNLLTTRQASTTIRLTDRISIDAQGKPARVFLPLDPGTAKLSLEFKLLKLGLFVFVVLLSYLSWHKQIGRYFISLVASREQDSMNLSAEQVKAHTNPWLYCGFALLVVVLLYRLFPYWPAPGFYIEDTMEFSDAAAGRSDIFSLQSFQYYRGYFVFVSELVVNIVNFFPATWAPHLYMITSSVFLLLALMAFSGSGLITSPWILLMGPSILLLGAFTDKVFFLSVTGLLFSTTLLVIALAFWRLPKQKVYVALGFIFIAALSWSGPYSAQLLPFAVLMSLFFGGKHRTLLFLFIGLMATAYVLTSASGLTQFSNLLAPEIPVAFFRALVQHILYFNLFGLLDYKFGLLMVALTLIVLYLGRANRVYQKASLIFLTIGLSSFLTYYISSKYQQYGGRLLSYHIVMSQFCWLFFLLLSADQLIKRIKRRAMRLGLGFVLATFFISMTIFKERELLKTVYFPPDPLLAEFLQAVKLSRQVELADNEYIQLWYVKRRQFFTTSFVRGSDSPNALPIDQSQLPDVVKKFLAPTHLRREINSMVDYDTGEGVLIYADLDDPSLKRKMPRPAHLN